MKKSLGVVLAAATVLSAGAMVVFAEAPGASDVQGPRGGRQGRLVQFLGLSEEQQTTWKTLHEQHKAEMEPLRQEGRDLHARLQAAVKADNPDPATVGSAFLALKAHREKAEAAQTAFHGRLAGVLNDEQKAKFEAFTARHGGRWGGRGGRRAPNMG
jgi:Spy/CpxP family protein refolding chaperone